MTQTTGQISARDCRISVDSQDISGSANNVKLTTTLDTEQTATFDGDWKLTTAGKLSWEISIEALYTEVTSEALDKIWAALKGAEPKEIVVTPKGGSAGDWTFTGNVIFNSVEIPFDGTAGDPVIITAKGAGTGELVKATAST